MNQKTNTAAARRYVANATSPVMAQARRKAIRHFTTEAKKRPVNLLNNLLGEVRERDTRADNTANLLEIIQPGLVILKYEPAETDSKARKSRAIRRAVALVRATLPRAAYIIVEAERPKKGGCRK